MTRTPTAHSAPLAELVSAVRDVVRLERQPAEAAELVASRIEPFLAQPNLLPDQYREGDPDRYKQHIVHAEEDGSFSVVALVWQPGQETPVHDHVAWCVTGVYEGAETEQQYELRGEGDTTRLVPVTEVVNSAGTACGFAPPGDIHLVRNAADSTVISIHVYGADIRKLSTSVRRRYHLPIADA
ncbi:cysteine dioxygenase family protein [Saccharopolyspora shandongensis]|uniref:cysteine dioxygenase family protein n=1 Tax=Saccharopolyspora shandongensis TaxID=418495 RepID=UPI0033DD3939